MSQSEFNIKETLEAEPQIIPDKEESIKPAPKISQSINAPKYPKFPQFEFWLATYQAKYRLEQRPFPDILAERAAIDLKNEFETFENETQRAEKRAIDEAEALEAVHCIIEDRIGYNSALFEFLKVEPIESIQKYCHESFKMPYSSIKASGEALRVHLYSATLEDINLYKLMQYFMKNSLDNEYLCEFIYDTVLNRLITERSDTSVNKTKDNPELEDYHLKKITKLLKPFLNSGHEEFEKRFDFHQKLKQDPASASTKLVKYSKELIQILSNLNALRKKHCTSLTRDFQNYVENELVQAEKGLKDLLQQAETLPDLVCRIILNAEAQGMYQPTIDNPNGLEIPQQFKITKYCREIFYALNIMQNWLNDIDKKLREAINASLEWESAVKKVRGKPIIPLSLDIPNFGGLRMMLPIPPEVLAILENQARNAEASEQISGQKRKETPEQGIIKLKDEKRQAVQQDFRGDKFLPQPDEEEQKALAEAAARLLEFKLKKEDELLKFQASVLEKRELKALQLQQRFELLRAALSEDETDIGIGDKTQELRDHEIEQLTFLMGKQRNLPELILNWFTGGDIKFSVFENMIKALSKGMVDFKPLDFHGSSHFSAYVPNTHKAWQKAVQSDLEQPYKMLFKQMTTVNSWKIHGGAHSDDILSVKARERCLKGLIRAGVTPERLKLARAKALDQKSVRKFA